MMTRDQEFDELFKIVTELQRALKELTAIVNADNTQTIVNLNAFDRRIEAMEDRILKHIAVAMEFYEMNKEIEAE
jgi:hypothetical protein